MIIRCDTICSETRERGRRETNVRQTLEPVKLPQMAKQESKELSNLSQEVRDTSER